MGNEGEGKMKRAVCLVSGGMDSCVAAAIASQNYPELFFLHLNYKQRTEKRERKAFRDIAKAYVMIGELDEALTMIDHVLSNPGEFSVQLLQIHPVWNPLRDLPRYPEILRKYR